MQKEKIEDILKGWDEETVLDPDPGLKIYILRKELCVDEYSRLKFWGNNQMADCVVSAVPIVNPCAIDGRLCRMSFLLDFWPLNTIPLKF
jgi:hypothetical protein